jgi:hypothetical protein
MNNTIREDSINRVDRVVFKIAQDLDGKIFKNEESFYDAIYNGVNKYDVQLGTRMERVFISYPGCLIQFSKILKKKIKSLANIKIKNQ